MALETHARPLTAQGFEFHRIDPKLAYPQMLASALMIVLWLAVYVVATWYGPSFLDGPWLTIVLGIAIAVHCALMVWRPIAVRYIGYARTDTELVITRGRMFRKVSIVPYGRIQYVDIDRGPLLRRWKLTKLTINTAASAGSVSIIGIPESDCTSLRDDLMRRCREQLAGV